MKVLFVGEGEHDIGDPDPSLSPRIAGGTIPTLARRVSPSIGAESIALQWTEIRRFNPEAKKRGYSAKMKAAALLATRKFGCKGTVAVADRDSYPDREEALQDAVAAAESLYPGHLIVWGLAFRSVEAWMLGDPQAIADELGVDVALVKKQYPPGVDVEDLSDNSGKEEHRPKQLLKRIFALKHQTDSTELRQAVAARTDVDTLEKACKNGFAPFAKRLRKLFKEESAGDLV